MLSLLAPFQAKACAALSAYAEHAFFLRKCLKNHALWVSDFPRQHNDFALHSALDSLSAQGFSCEMNPSARLLMIDLSPTGYELLLAPLPARLPALPAHDALHPAYALCRLLFCHPAPLSAQPPAALRSVLKACDSAAPNICLQLIPPLHMQCAAWLRERRPLPHAAGSVLSAWLDELETSRTNEGGDISDP